jgi:hypothetical protein
VTQLNLSIILEQHNIQNIMRGSDNIGRSRHEYIKQEVLSRNFPIITPTLKEGFSTNTHIALQRDSQVAIQFNAIQTHQSNLYYIHYNHLIIYSNSAQNEVNLARLSVCLSILCTQLQLGPRRKRPGRT